MSCTYIRKCILLQVRQAGEALEAENMSLRAQVRLCLQENRGKGVKACWITATGLSKGRTIGSTVVLVLQSIER